MGACPSQEGNIFIRAWRRNCGMDNSTENRTYQTTTSAPCRSSFAIDLESPSGGRLLHSLSRNLQFIFVKMMSVQLKRLVEGLNTIAHVWRVAKTPRFVIEYQGELLAARCFGRKPHQACSLTRACPLALLPFLNVGDLLDPGRSGVYLAAVPVVLVEWIHPLRHFHP